MSRRPRSLLAAAALIASTLSPVSPAHAAAPPAAPAGHASVARASGPPQGPHSPRGRTKAPLTVRTTRSAIVREVDLGDITLGPRADPGRYRAPVRGILVTPRRAAAHAPLVVFGHLRMPGCSTMVLTYPCPKGATEMRYDRGMTWFGEALAAQGYAVLIPDLAPIFSPDELKRPYDQHAAWLRVTGMLRSQMLAGNAGRASAWGTGLRGMIDGRDTTLIVHSRSVYVVPDVVAAWRRSATPIGQIMAYGAAHETLTTGGAITPFPADIPFLDIGGTSDGDVGHAGSQWFTELIGVRRSAPAFHVDVDGYGHSYINRELSRRGLDDRRGPSSGPSAAQHEQLLTRATLGWLAQTVRGKHVFPMKSTEPLPNGLIGTPARYLVATPGATGVVSQRHSRWAAPLGRGASVRVCRNFTRMDPTPYPYRCPDVDDGTPISDSFMTRVRLGRGVGARITLRARHPKMVALHLAPTRDRRDRLGYTPMTLTVRMSDGRRYTVPLGRRYNALREWPHPYGVGQYYVQTARVPLPSGARRGTMTSLELTAPRPGEVDIRAIDVVGG